MAPLRNRKKVLLMTSRSGGGFNIAPPLGLYRLKHVLESDGIPCEILDFDIEDDAPCLARIASGDFSIVGMSVSHCNMEEDLATLVRYRRAAEALPNPPLYIAGGQEAALNCRQWLETGLIDLVFLGFAEESLLSFCKCWDGGYDFRAIAQQVEGTAFLQEDGEVRIVHSSPLTKERFRWMSLDNAITMEIPYQRYWDIARSRRIQSGDPTEFIAETVRLYTSSHCPRSCGFCSSQSFIPFSQDKPSPIFMLTAEEIHRLVHHYCRKYGARGFLFSDDDFPVGNREGILRLQQFCDLIIKDKSVGELPTALRFFCQSRVADFIDTKGLVRRPLIRLMKEAGFENTGIGVETFSDRLLSVPSVNKVGITAADCRLVLDVLLEEHIIPIIFIVVGIPETTVQELVETMDVAVSYLLKGASVSVTERLRVNPGSPLSLISQYAKTVRTWINPLNGHEVTIADHVIPIEPSVAAITDSIRQTTDREIEMLRHRMGWPEGAIISKPVMGIATFIATARLLGVDNAVERYQRCLNRLLMSEGGDKQDVMQNL